VKRDATYLTNELALAAPEADFFFDSRGLRGLFSSRNQCRDKTRRIRIPIPRIDFLHLLVSIFDFYIYSDILSKRVFPFLSDTPGNWKRLSRRTEGNAVSCGLFLGILDLFCCIFTVKDSPTIHVVPFPGQSSFHHSRASSTSKTRARRAALDLETGVFLFFKSVKWLIIIY